MEYEQESFAKYLSLNLKGDLVFLIQTIFSAFQQIAMDFGFFEERPFTCTTLVIFRYNGKHMIVILES